MADLTPTTPASQRSDPSSQTSPAVTASSTTARATPSTSSRTSAPSLAPAWLQPSLSALPIRPDPGSAGSTYSYLAPQTSLLQGIQGNYEKQKNPKSVASFPSVHRWGMASHLPASFYGPQASQYRNHPTASSLEQLCGHPHLQPVPSLQLVQIQPPGEGLIHTASFQDGRDLHLYSNVSLAHIPSGERAPILQRGRPVTTTPAPNNKVVLVLGEADTQHTVARVPVSGLYHAPPASGNINSQNLPSSTFRKPKDLMSTVWETQPGRWDKHLPPPPQSGAPESATGNSHLLVDFVDDKECTDIETLVASIEPLLPECLFPPLECKGATKGSLLEEMPSEGGRASKEGQAVRSQAQEESTLELATRTEVLMCPASSPPVTTGGLGEGVIPSVGLCNSEDEAKDVLGAKKPAFASGAEIPKRPERKHPSVSLLGKGSHPQAQKTLLPPATQVPISPQRRRSNVKLPEVNGKRKMGEVSGAPLQKVPKASESLQGPRPQHLPTVVRTAGSRPVQTSIKEKNTPGTMPAREKKVATGPRAEELPLKKISARSLEVDVDIIRVKCAQNKVEQNKSTSEKTNSSKEQGQEKPKGSVSLLKIKGKKNTGKAEAEAARPIPRTNLAQHMMESVQVFHPLGKNTLPAMTTTKLAPAPSSSMSGNTPAMVERPLPTSISRQQHLSSFFRKQPVLPKEPLPALTVKSLQGTNVLPKQTAAPLASLAPSSTQRPAADQARLQVARPSSVARPAASSQLPSTRAGPLCNPVPKPPASRPFELQPSQLSKAPWWKAQANVGCRMSGVPKPPDIPTQNLWRSCCSQRGPRNTELSSAQLSRQPPCPNYSPPSTVQEFRGDTFIPWRTPPDDLEVSQPITKEQRPIREMMKERAQKERAEAAQWTSVGRVQYFVERQKEMDISIRFGYPWCL